MKLIGSHASPYARKVRAFALEKGIDLPFELANPMAPDSPVAVWNPLGKVPVLLRQDGSALYDSRVIVEYLEELGDGPALIPAAQRIEVRRIEALADGVTDAGLLIRFEALRPEHERSPAWVERQADKVRRGLAVLAADLAGRDWYFAGRPTLADLAAGACLAWLRLRLPEFDWAAGHPALAALLARLEDRPSFATTRPVA